MYDDYSLDILYIDENIHHELFQLVINRSTSQLDIRLNQLDNPILYLTTVEKYHRHQVSLLILASLLGYDDIVRVLLSHDSTRDHVELKGTVVVSDQLTINGATALYCACYHGQFTVAKTLIELGHADVNQTSDDDRSYPLLLHATKMNRCDIIDFLLDNNYADINETKTSDRFHHTALVVAFEQGCTSLMEYLIGKGANVNNNRENSDPISTTLIGRAVSTDRIDALRVLYRAGADVNIKNKDGTTLLMTAVKRKHLMIIDFLLDEHINTIEDLEIAVCSSVHRESTREEISCMFPIVKMAIERRVRFNLPKVTHEAIAVYDYQEECQTVDELESIKHDPDRVYLETLLIRERISLSRPVERVFIAPLEYHGVTLVERGQHEKAFDWCIHIFYLLERINLPTELAAFVWLFCRSLTRDGTIPMEWFLQVAQMVFVPSHLKDKHFSPLNTMFLIIIATKILEQEGLSENERTSIYSWVKRVCRLQLTDKNGKTLLHLCVDGAINDTINFRPNDIRRYIKFPNEAALRLLLGCGGRWLDLDAVEHSSGNTPLHLLCMNSTNRTILELLLKLGCHTDCVNKGGQTPLYYIEDPDLRSLYSSKTFPSKLKCLCARLIAKEHLNVNELGASTSALQKFVVLHGHHPKEETS